MLLLIIIIIIIINIRDVKIDIICTLEFSIFQFPEQSFIDQQT